MTTKNPKSSKPKIQKENYAGKYVVEEEVPVFYGRIPQDLLRDPSIHSVAVRLWGVCHTYSFIKKSRPFTEYLTQKTLAENIGVGREWISKSMKLLETRGWMTIHRRGLTEPNVIILHWKPNSKKQK